MNKNAVGSNEQHWLDKLMEEYKISSAYKLAREADIDESVLYSMKGERKTPIGNMKLENAIKIAKVLNISVEKMYKKYS